MKKINNTTILIIVLSISFGFLSGILGFVFVSQNNFTLPLFGKVNFDNVNQNQKIVIEQPRNVIVEQDLQLKQIENDLFPTLVNIYNLKKTNNIINQVYLDSEILGQGFVLTSDGWIITTKDVIVNPKTPYDVVGYQNKKYQVSDFVKDDITGVTFGKIEGNGLSVAKLGNSKDLSVGQLVVVVSQKDELILTHIRKIGKTYSTINDIVESSDDLNKDILLNIDLSTDDFGGAVVVNLKGEIIGIVVSGRVVMVDYFKNIITQVLDKKEVKRPSLGIQYIDLAQTRGLIDISEKGAYVYASPLKGSPAYGKVQKDDIIKKIDDIEINNFQSLSELINTYKSGDSIELLIKRGDSDITVGITLK